MNYLDNKQTLLWDAGTPGTQKRLFEVVRAYTGWFKWRNVTARIAYSSRNDMSLSFIRICYNQFVDRWSMVVCKFAAPKNHWPILQCWTNPHDQNCWLYIYISHFTICICMYIYIYYVHNFWIPSYPIMIVWWYLMIYVYQYDIVIIYIYIHITSLVFKKLSLRPSSMAKPHSTIKTKAASTP